MSRNFLVPILLPADPTVALEAATKQYVDATAGGTGNVLAFGFNATTTEPPTGNQVRLNNATQTSATLVWISQTTWDGLDVTLGLARINSGYQLYMQDFNDAAKWLLFNVTAAGTDKGSYWEFPITYNSGPGGLPAAKMALQSITPASHGIPSGGADGDVLTKTSASNYAAAWETPTGGGTPVGTKMTALTALTGAGAATTDIIEVVDISDTTLAASGTNKKITLAELITFLKAQLPVTDQAVMSVPGNVALTTGTLRYYFNRAVTVTNVRLSAGTAPTGASLILDLNKNGTTIFTTQGNRPTLAIGSSSDATSVPDVTSFASGDYMTVDVDQVGSTVAGANLTLQVEFTYT